MPKARKTKRKAPVTVSDHTSATRSGSSSNPQSTRSVIRRFHVLIKRQTQLQKALSDKRSTHVEDDVLEELTSIEHEITKMGGLAAYQRMSSIGQGNDRGGGSEKVLIEWLKGMSVPQTLQREARGMRLRLLEVGALKPDNYASCTSWIEATPIDLHSQHPSIREQDFLLMNEAENRSKWNIISLSLVVNFVPDPKDRGRMLRLAHAMLKPGGYLFLALPLPCITNSRYMTPEHLQGLMEALFFSQVKSRWKDGGKMAYWLFQKSVSQDIVADSRVAMYEKKVVLRQGDRNNFCILL